LANGEQEGTRGVRLKGKKVEEFWGTVNSEGKIVEKLLADLLKGPRPWIGKMEEEGAVGRRKEGRIKK